MERWTDFLRGTSIKEVKNHCIKKYFDFVDDFSSYIYIQKITFFFFCSLMHPFTLAQLHFCRVVAILLKNQELMISSSAQTWALFQAQTHPDPWCDIPGMAMGIMGDIHYCKLLILEIESIQTSMTGVMCTALYAFFLLFWNRTVTYHLLRTPGAEDCLLKHVTHQQGSAQVIMILNVG